MRDRLVAEAAGHPDWVPGSQGACRWARPARPDLFAWAAGDPLRRPGNVRDPEGTGVREAVACDGALPADTGGVLLRLCEGRPVSATTGDDLGWVGREPAGEGKRVFALAWDNAARPVRKRGRPWIDRHGRRARRAQTGCRIRGCGLPVKAPWLNAIEPKWVHGKRAVIEPGRTLTADELQQRVCDCFGCPREPPSPKPQQ